MNERIVVKIGCTRNNTSCRSKEDNVNWLKETFDMSYKRASNLYNEMRDNPVSSSICYATVVLSHQQLAKYTAKRQVDGLTQFWKYPYVIEYEEHPIPKDTCHPTELRPDYRSRGGFR